MATITVTGQLLNGLGEPIVGEYVYFRVTGAGTDTANDAVYPRKTFTLGPSDSSGDLPSDDIWVNGDSGVQSYYEVLMPGGERIDIVIPSGTTGTVDLSDLLGNSYRVTASAQAGATDNLNAIGGLATTDGNIIVGNGTNWVAESGATARTSLGVGTGDAVTFNSLTLATGATVDNIETTVTDDDTHAPTSGAIVDYVEAQGSKLHNTIFVSKGGTDTRTGLNPHDITNPFLTCTAALAAASSGDLIWVLPGDYSGESALAGKDGVNWKIEEGAISPSFVVSENFSFSIIGNVGGYVVKDGASGVIKIYGSIEEFLLINNGSQVQLYGANITYDGSANPTVQLDASSVFKIYDSRVESTDSGKEVVNLSNTWSGSLIAKNCEFVNTTVATNEATTGIFYGTGVTGTVQLKDCTIITAQDGTGTAKSIDAPSAQTVYIQGALNQTHNADSDVTYEGGLSHTNTNFTA